jgi:hypothetical protein
VGGLAPLVKILNDFTPIKSGILTGGGTRAIAADVCRIIPELQGRLIFSAAPAVGSVDSAFLLTAAVTGKNITAEALNRALKARLDPARTLVLPIGEDLYQIQIAALCGGEDAYAAELVKTLKYFAEPKAGSPANPAANSTAVTKPAVKTPMAGAAANSPALKSGAPKPAAGSKTPVTGAAKAGTAKKAGQKPAGGAKPSTVPAPPRKPLINFPK